MELALKAVSIVVDLILPLAVGYLCTKQRWLGAQFFDRMITLNILVLYPVLSILTFWEMHLRAELIWLPILGVILSVIPGLVAYKRAKAKYNSSLDQGSYILSAMLSNTLTLGGLSAFILYGEIGFAYMQLIVLLGPVILFMFCYPMAQYFRERSVGGDKKPISLAAVLFNRNQLPVVGLFIGMALYLSGIPRPGWMAVTVDPLVHAAAWTALIPVGYSADFSEMRKYWRDTMDLTLIKFVITPVLTFAIAKLVVHDIKALNTVLIAASTPTAINAVITVKIYDLNIHYTMASFIVTTLVYLLIVFPLLFLWMG